MSKSDTLSLVQCLANNMADPTTIDDIYTDVMFELGRENWFVDANLIGLVPGQRAVDLRAALGPALVNTLGVIYDDAELEAMPLRALEALDSQWRDALGYPRSYVTQDQSSHVIALHPRPQVASNPDLGSFGEPLGLDYPTYNLALFYSYAAIPPFDAPWYYLELVVALRIIALEFQRESDHTDLEFSQAAQGLSDLCKQLLV